MTHYILWLPGFAKSHHFELNTHPQVLQHTNPNFAKPTPILAQFPAKFCQSPPTKARQISAPTSPSIQQELPTPLTNS